jgi:hypothetical protein
MLKPICVKCARFYRMKKGGFYFVEGMPRAGSHRPESGIEHDAEWEDYKLWVGDLWECRGCGHELISGVGYMPLAENFQEGFQRWVDECGAKFRVNDC